MGCIRSWIFRVLVLVGGGLLLYTWFQPWWQAFIVQLNEIAISIYAWALESNVPVDYEYMMTGLEDAMPGWFFPFMWVYLGVAVAALLFSLFASSAKGISIGRIRVSLPTTLVGAVGLSYIGVVIAAVLTIAMQAPNFFDAPLQGSVLITIDMYQSEVRTSFQFGYWLACGVGPFLVILAALRRFIVGKRNA